MFLVALWLGGTPDLNFGFVSTSSGSGSPAAAPVTASTTTTVVDTTTTTEEVVSAAELDLLVAEIGFPSVSLEADGPRIVVAGVVPDDASRRVVLQRVSAIEGVIEVVDELEIRAEPLTASARVQLTGSTAVLSGLVNDDSTVEQLQELLAVVYLTEQISSDLLVVDPDAAELDSLVVTGEVTDSGLAQQLTRLFESLDSLRADVELVVSEKPRVEMEIEILLAEREIRFATGDSEVSDEAGLVLDELAAILAQFPNASIEVGGHTDGQGNDSDNLDLSQRRAAAVVAGLRERGVEAVLTPAGYGELRPKVSPEASDEDRAQNRRIEFRLVNG